MVIPANSLSEEELAILEDEAKKAARAGMLAFTKYTKPDYAINWHHAIIAAACDDFIAMRKKRIIIEAPPRTGKSEMVSRRMPAKIFGDMPSAKVIHATYGDTLSKKFNRDIQRVMMSPEYMELYPETRLNQAGVVTSDGDARRNKKEFDVIGYSDSYFCTGVGGPINGMGATHLIIDDPVKGRKSADSEIYREALWDWYVGDASIRLDGAGAIMVMHTRWHDDDLVGRLLKQQAEAIKMGSLDPEYIWHVISLPAILEDEGKKHPNDPRRKGGILWPWHWAGRNNSLSRQEQVRRARAFLEMTRGQGMYSFSALFQQDPSPKGGGMFKVEMMKIVKTLPSPVVKWVRYWDKAGTEDGGKNTAGVKMGLMANGQYVVMHVIKGQWAVERREATITQTLISDGKSGQTWIEREGGSGGKESADATIKNNAGHRIFSESPQGNKEARAEGFMTQVNIGNVVLLEGEWNADYIEEHRRFNRGKFKDQVDASSGAFNKLTQKGRDFSALTKA